MFLDRLVQNRTFLPCRAVLLEHRSGLRKAVVIAKLTYERQADGDGEVSLASEQSFVRTRDVRESDAPDAALMLPSDVAAEKPGTDVVLIGHARPPKASCTQMLVSLRVRSGDRVLARAVSVHGRRRWTRSMRGVVPGRAEPLTPTALTWANTWGGRIVTASGDEIVEARNPAGRGLAERPELRIGHETPSVEDPSRPLDRPDPAPACFAPIEAGWAPRAGRQGTADDTWRRTWAPLPPKDQDPRHACFAPDGLWSETPLDPALDAEVIGVTPSGRWTFSLPAARPRFEARLRSGTRELPTHLDTVVIDADRRTVELTWRGILDAPRRMGELEALGIGFAIRPPEALIDAVLHRPEARAS